MQIQAAKITPVFVDFLFETLRIIRQNTYQGRTLMSCRSKYILHDILIFLVLFISYLPISHANEKFYVFSSENQDLLSQGPESVYKVAVELYKRQDYQKAKEKFQRVQQLKCNYKATNQFLGRIEQHLSFARSSESDQKQKQLEQSAKKEEEKIQRSSQIEKKLIEARIKEKERLRQEEQQAKLDKRNSRKKIERARKQIQKEKRKEEKLVKNGEKKNLRDMQRKRARLEKERMKKERLARKKEEEEEKLFAEIRRKEQMRYEKQKEFARLLNEKRDELQKRKKLRRASFERTREDVKPSLFAPQPYIFEKNRDQLAADLHQRDVFAQSLARINELNDQLKKAFSSRKYDLTIALMKRMEGALAVHEVPGSYEKKVRDRMAYYTQRIEVAKQRKKVLKAEKEKTPAPEIKQISLTTKPSLEKKTDENVAGVRVSKTTQLIDEEKNELLKQRQHQRRKELLSEVDAIYKKGLRYYKNGDFEGAREIFMEVDRSWPEYKLTRRYLNIVNEEATNKKVLKRTLDVTAKKIPKTRSHIVAEALDAFENN